MANLKTYTVTEQVAAHLRDELRRGRWQDRMPGRDQLASEIGASNRCVQGALELLEQEGLLEKQGVGQQRRIRLDKIVPSLLGVCFLREAPERANESDRRAGKWGLIAGCLRSAMVLPL